MNRSRHRSCCECQDNMTCRRRSTRRSTPFWKLRNKSAKKKKDSSTKAARASSRRCAKKVRRGCLRTWSSWQLNRPLWWKLRGRSSQPYWCHPSPPCSFLPKPTAATSNPCANHLYESHHRPLAQKRNSKSNSISARLWRKSGVVSSKTQRGDNQTIKLLRSWRAVTDSFLKLCRWKNRWRTRAPLFRVHLIRGTANQQTTLHFLTPD